VRWQRGRGGGGRLVEDRRGAGGFGGGFPVGARGGMGGLGLVGVLIAILSSTGVLGGGNGGFGVPSVDPFPAMPQAQGSPPPEDAKLVEFVKFVVGDVEDSWARLFAEAGRRYEPTSLVLFSRATTTGCGPASSETGPFYCPADRKVYLDLGFFRELRTRFGAPGDFAQAYVIAHEFGHHVQNLLGLTGDVERAQREHAGEANTLSVRLELQADCFAGVWGHAAGEQNLLEPGDVEEGLGAAAAVGDDRLQRQAGQAVNPESWTHGSSEQRVTWFKRGFDSGDPNSCNTFAG
jgi:uncharacterized protein